MSTFVKILNFEPLIHRILILLLSKESDLAVVEEDAENADVLLFRPVSPESVLTLRSQFPVAHFVAMVEWHRRSLFETAPIDVYLDALAAYESILAGLRRRRS